MPKKNLVSVFISVFMLLILSPPEIKGTHNAIGKIVAGRIDAGKQVLLLIAVNEYKYPEWKDLRGPIRDAVRLQEVLTENYHFDKVITLYNQKATKKAIYTVISSFNKGGDNQLAKNDSLFIYYTGHGYLDKKSDKGYWIPYDGAGVNNKTFGKNWLGNSELIGLIKKIEADHILIASDSCFAGTLVENFKGDNFILNNFKVLNTIYSIRARKILTAGAKEEVPDDSIFASLFIDELENNKTNLFVKINSIYSKIENQIIAKTGNRVKGNKPLYGDLKGLVPKVDSRFILFTKKGWKKLVQPVELIKYPPAPGTTQFSLKKGYDHLYEGNLEMGEKNFLDILVKKPDTVEAINGLGIVYFNEKKYKKAKQAFNRVITLDPHYFKAYNYLGLIYTEQGDYENARNILEKATGSEKNHLPEYAFINLASMEIKRGDLDSALGYIKQGLYKNRHYAALYNLRGLILEMREEYIDSIASYKKALSALDKEGVDDVSILINLGRVHAKEGGKIEAIKILKEALEKADSDRSKEQINALIKKINND